MPSVDAEIIAELVQLGKETQTDLLSELITLFLDLVPNTLVKLTEAVQANQCATVSSTAHSLKSSAGNLGARRLSSLCNELEQASLRKQIPLLKHLFEQLQLELKQVVQELQVLRNQRAA